MRRLNEIMTDRTIKLYTTDFCRFCKQAKMLLDGLGMPYVEVDASRSPESRKQLFELTGRMTFPQIIVGEHPVGGYEDLVVAAGDGSLAALVAS